MFNIVLNTSINYIILKQFSTLQFNKYSINKTKKKTTKNLEMQIILLCLKDNLKIIGSISIMIKKVLPFILIISFSYPFFLLLPEIIALRFIEETSTEYSIGLSNKTSFYGLVSKDWIKTTDYGESYITAGSIGLIGSYGYGRTYYLSKGAFTYNRLTLFSPHISLTGFGYYVLAIGANGGFAVSANLSADIFTLKLKKSEFKFQFGFFTAYDPIKNKSIALGADNGPSWLMPSVNFKVRFLK